MKPRKSRCLPASFWGVFVWSRLSSHCMCMLMHYGSGCDPLLYVPKCLDWLAKLETLGDLPVRSKLQGFMSCWMPTLHESTQSKRWNPLKPKCLRSDGIRFILPKSTASGSGGKQIGGTGRIDHVN